MKTAIYPGSFDPVTLGHLDIIKRAAVIFDNVVICVMVNSEKAPLFTPEERMKMLGTAVKGLGNVEIDMSDGLLADYARKKEACVVIKGLRAISDFEKEFQMALVNRRLNPGLDTFFMASSEEYTYLSSSIVKELARHGTDLSGFVPKEIIRDIEEKMRKRRQG